MTVEKGAICPSCSSVLPLCGMQIGTQTGVHKHGARRASLAAMQRDIEFMRLKLEELAPKVARMNPTSPTRYSTKPSPSSPSTVPQGGHQGGHRFAGTFVRPAAPTALRPRGGVYRRMKLYEQTFPAQRARRRDWPGSHSRLWTTRSGGPCRGTSPSSPAELR
jgi:hypothetical protein